MQENKTKFKYTYSAPTEEERREIENIRIRYSGTSSEYGKLQRLRRLDKLVNSTAQTISLSVGIVGSLIFGLGFAMILEWSLLVPGILVSAVGMGLASSAYPVNLYFLKRGKNKYGAEILRLTEELLNENE